MQFIRHLLISLLIALSLTGSLASVPAYADTASSASSSSSSAAGEQGGFFKDLSKVAKGVVNRVMNVSTSSLVSTAKGYAGRLTSSGLAIGGALAMVYLLWKVMLHLAAGGKGDSPLQIVLDVVVPAGLAGMFISGYGGYISSIDSGLDAVRNVAGDTNSMLNNLESLYEAVFGMVSQAFEDAFDALGDACGVGEALSGDLLVALGDLLVTCIFGIVIVVIAMIGLAEVAGLILMGPFLFAVGVAFGPIFIAGLVTPWTREYTTKWLGFLVSAATLTGVLSIIIALANNVMGSLNVSSIAQAEGAGSAAQMCIACVILLAINSLIAQAPTVASALVPGSIGARTGAGGGIRGGAGVAATVVTTPFRTGAKIYRASKSSTPKTK